MTDRCKNCGACKHCGAGGYAPWSPWRPYWPYYGHSGWSHPGRGTVTYDFTAGTMATSGLANSVTKNG